MKRTLFLIFISLPYFINAQDLDFEWAKRFGSPDAETYSRSMTTDPAGNVFTLGSFKGSVDFDPGPGVFILSSGTNIYGTSFICKLDSSGNFLWAGKMDISGVSIISDKNGNILVLGSYGGSVDVDPGPGAFDPGFGNAGSTCCVKLDNAGNFIWARAFIGGQSSAEPCFGSSICIDATQHIYIGGSFAGTTDFDPGPGSYKMTGLYQQIPSRASYPLPTFFVCSLDSSGNFRYAKNRGSYNRGGVTCAPRAENTVYYNNNNASIYFEKWDVNGNLLWTKAIKPVSPGPSASVISQVVTTDRIGNIWVAGYFSGSIDFDPGNGQTLSTPTDDELSLFVLKLDSQGNLLQVSQMKRAAGSSVTWSEIFTDTVGNCYLGGWFSGTFDFDPGIMTAKLTSATSNGFLLKYSADFNFKGVMLIAENTSSNLQGACIDNFGSFYLSGGFSGSGDFNPGTDQANLVCEGKQDAYIIKIARPVMLSIQDQGFKDYIHFFPNPVKGTLYLNMAQLIDHGKCFVIDASGKIVLEYADISGRAFAIDLTELQSGLYIVRVSDAKYSQHAKIIKD